MRNNEMGLTGPEKPQLPRRFGSGLIEPFSVPFSLPVQFKISGSVGWIAPLLGGVGRALAVVSLLLEPVAAGLAAGKPASDCRAAQVRVRGYT